MLNPKQSFERYFSNRIQIRVVPTKLHARFVQHLHLLSMLLLMKLYVFHLSRGGGVLTDAYEI